MHNDLRYQRPTLKTTRARHERLLGELRTRSIERDRLLKLLEQSTLRRFADAAPLNQLMMGYLGPVADVFDLDRESRRHLQMMIRLTQVGRLFQCQPSPEDPYAFAQTEWLLHDCGSLSIAAVAMSLSLERKDGRGPLNIGASMIPGLSSAYRCLLVIAQERLSAPGCRDLQRRITQSLAPFLPATVRERVVTTVASVDPKSGAFFLLAPTQLCAGMRVTRDVHNPQGVLLIAKDTVLDEHLVDRLQGYDHGRQPEWRIPVCVSVSNKSALKSWRR